MPPATRKCRSEALSEQGEGLLHAVCKREPSPGYVADVHAGRDGGEAVGW